MSAAASGSHLVAAPRPALWEVLSDPERLAATLPGVVFVAFDEETRFRALVRPSTGLGATPLELELEIREQRPPARVRLAGRGLGSEREVEFDLVMELADADQGCAVEWRAEIGARGVFGSLTQRTLTWLLRDQVELALQRAGAEAQPDTASA